MPSDGFPEPVLRNVWPGDTTIDHAARLAFCKDTSKAIGEIADARGWLFRPRQQLLMKEFDDHLLVAFFEFAASSQDTWVEVEFEPLAFKPLAWEIIYGETMKWDLELRADNVTRVEVPMFKSAGWSDADVSAEENAVKTLNTLDEIAHQLPTKSSFSDFIQQAEYPALYRAAEAVSLILEGKHSAARELAAAILRGEVSRSGLVVENEVLSWLERIA